MSKIMITHDLMRRPRGRLRLFSTQLVDPSACRAIRRIPLKLISEADNLYVNAGLPVLANLLAAGTPGYVAAAVGFGSGNTAPTVSDTDLSLAPKYYNAISSHIVGPSSSPAVASGSVLFNYGLSTTDYAANPLTVQELGLYANTAAIELPNLIGGSFSAWAATHVYTIGNLIIDGNGNIQRCSVAGTSGSTVHSWATAVGNTTIDGTVTWTVVALHNLPGPMIAHVVVPSFAYTGTGNYSGTWTISM